MQAGRHFKGPVNGLPADPAAIVASDFEGKAWSRRAAPGPAAATGQAGWMEPERPRRMLDHVLGQPWWAGN